MHRTQSIFTLLLNLSIITLSKEVSGIRRRNTLEERFTSSKGLTLIKQIEHGNNLAGDDEVYEFWKRKLGYKISMVYSKNVKSTGKPTIKVNNPTNKPTLLPTLHLTNTPTLSPTNSSTLYPTLAPTEKSTSIPTKDPSKSPTFLPTINPTREPSLSPITNAPSTDKTIQPTHLGDSIITFHKYLFKIFKMHEFLENSPLQEEQQVPSKFPTLSPTIPKSKTPAAVPEDVTSTLNPTVKPTIKKSAPTKSPTKIPTQTPTNGATQTSTTPVTSNLNPVSLSIDSEDTKNILVPPKLPTKTPTQDPTSLLTQVPTSALTLDLTNAPTLDPTSEPNLDPTSAPTLDPITFSTIQEPTNNLSTELTEIPASDPKKVPTMSIRTNDPTFIKMPTPPPLTTQYSKEKSAAVATSCELMTPAAKQRILEKIFVTVSGQKALKNPNSPQSKAASWMLNDINILCPNDDNLLQRYTAAVFYFSTGGQNWYNSYNFLTSNHECEWSDRMICDDKNKITEIVFYDNNMTGRIPDEIDILSSLTTLSLTKGKLQGTIPESLYNITTLKVFELSENSMKGKLSKKLYSLLGLRILNLNDNMFGGPIEPQINYLKRLSSLKLHNNRFYGLMRRELKDLNSLETGTFHGNNLTGRVPTRMCNLFKSSNGMLQTLTADCAGSAPEVECICCTRCY